MQAKALNVIWYQCRSPFHNIPANYYVPRIFLHCLLWMWIYQQLDSITISHKSAYHISLLIISSSLKKCRTILNIAATKDVTTVRRNVFRLICYFSFFKINHFMLLHCMIWKMLQWSSMKKNALAWWSCVRNCFSKRLGLKIASF